MLTVTFTLHSQARMFERGITVLDVRTVLESGQVIETLTDRQPQPSYTVLGWVGDRPLHVICVDGEPDERIIITLYDPSARPDLWEPDFQRRVQ